MLGLRFILDLTSVWIVGSVVTLALASAVDRRIDTARLTRGGVVAGVLSSLTALALLVATLGLVLDQPPVGALLSGELLHFLDELPSGRALLAHSTLMAAAAIVLSRARSTRAVVVVLILACAGTASSAFGGHAGSSTYPVLAVIALVAHVVAAALWLGGLLGLGAIASSDGKALASVLPRFSALALWCAAVVGCSGVAGALIHIPALERMWTTDYGTLVFVKTLAFLVLVAFGAAHRRHLIRAGGTTRTAFLRLAVGELAVMAGAVGAGVALSRTAPPGSSEMLHAVLPPGPPSTATLLGSFRADAFGLLAVSVCSVLYLTGLVALRRRGDRWPPHRTALYFGGVGTVFVVTCTGVGTYALSVFSVHMVQHMALNMIAPLLILLGAPMTLFLRTLRTPARRTVLRSMEAPAVRLLAHPVVSTLFFVASLYVLYFTPLFEAAMANHWGHLLMQAHFFLSGLLFFWFMVAVDPIPRSINGAPRVPLLLVVVVAHTVFAMVLVFGRTVLGGDYFVDQDLPWLPSRLDDQALGGALAWFLGEATTIAVLAWIILRWFAAAERADRAVARHQAPRITPRP